MHGIRFKGQESLLPPHRTTLKQLFHTAGRISPILPALLQCKLASPSQPLHYHCNTKGLIKGLSLRALSEPFSHLFALGIKKETGLTASVLGFIKKIHLEFSAFAALCISSCQIRGRGSITSGYQTKALTPEIIPPP